MAVTFFAWLGESVVVDCCSDCGAEILRDEGVNEVFFDGQMAPAGDEEDEPVADRVADAIESGHVVAIGIAAGADSELSFVQPDWGRPWGSPTSGYLVEPLALGWFCRACKVFNGDAKEFRLDCRSCGETRPKVEST